MSQKKCIFIGGKQIGVNCLRILLDHGITPKLVVPNSDDDRETRWHESLIKVAKEKNLPLISKKSLKDQRVIDRIRA
ncbi:MAG: hypothetical protein Q8Q49_00205, partial [bacterium]|nr:hypothetical protein [bacterium]